MWPSDMKDSVPETSAEPRRPAIKNQSQLRVMNFKFIVALYVVIMGLLTVVLYTGFSPMLRPLITLLAAVGLVSLLLRSQTRWNSRRTFNLPKAPTGIVPEGAKKVYDLKDLPPEVAANPEVQKMFELAGGHGAWVKITRRAQVIGQKSQNPETVKIVTASSEAGHPQVDRAQVGGVKETAQLPPDLASSVDIHKLAEFVKSHGRLPAESQDMEELGAPLSSKLMSILGRIVTWTSFIVILAALAVAAVALWTLNGTPHPH
jgi:hypothetical protein